MRSMAHHSASLIQIQGSCVGPKREFMQLVKVNCLQKFTQMHNESFLHSHISV